MDVQAFEDDMASMLAAHNKKFRATPKYEPRMPLKVNEAFLCGRCLF